MSILTEKEGLCISSMRDIPSTIATQFSDNANKPFWSFKDTVKPGDDFFDCYASFKELDCEEYFWDWESRKLDELLIKRLLESYSEYFKKNQIGRDKFITFTVSNNKDLEDLGKLYMSIISSHDYAKKNKLYLPPLFEVAHNAKSGSELTRFAKLYNESVLIATEKFKQECSPKVISIIPIHNFKEKDWFNSINTYLKTFRNNFRCNIEYLRPIIPRSKIADQAGFVAATIATKRALSSYYAFAEIMKIDVFPIVETSTSQFRGGLSPTNINNFIKNYPGCKSVTISASYRFDYDIARTQVSIQRLNKLLPKNNPLIYSKEDITKLKRIEVIFANEYKKVITELPNLPKIPNEYKELTKRDIPSSIKKTFTMYSLGVAPELFGVGKALLQIINHGLAKDLENFYPNIKSDLVQAGTLLNKENLKFLSIKDKFYKNILRDIHLIEDYVGTDLGPDSTDSFMHRNHTSNVFHKMHTKKEFGEDLVIASKLRKFLG